MPSPTPSETTADHIIIGAGLSGLTTAYYLKKNWDVTCLILEGRDEIGGRIKTTDSIDLGATWFGEQHSNLLSLLDELHIDSFPQYQKGNSIFIHSTIEPPHYFDAQDNSNPTYRISGGSENLIRTLACKSETDIKLGETIDSINDIGKFIELKTADTIYTAKKVVVTIPPQLAAQRIAFEPNLSAKLIDVMTSTHTWMSNAIKIGITFDNPFWREKNFPGTLIAPNGPVIELYDHSNPDDSSFSLMGFANEALREHSTQERKQIIIDFLADYFGSQIKNYTSFVEKDWLKDDFTATSKSQSIYMHPSYGNKVWQNSYMNGKLMFSGSETSDQFGGYMEGAVASGKRAIEFIKKSENHNS